MWKHFWKYALVFVGAGLLGLGGGFAGGLFAYPYIFLADIVAMDARPADSVPVVATGMFIHANPSDPIHHGTGGVTVYEKVVHLEEDFAVGPGPAFHVYLVPHLVRALQRADLAGGAHLRPARNDRLGRPGPAHQASGSRSSAASPLAAVS